MDQAQHLRNIVKWNDQKKQRIARVITVTSGKGGTGKTSTAINLAVQMRKKGKRVIIFDADFGLANIEIMFGAAPTFNLLDLIKRNKNIKEIITNGPMDIGFISGGSGIDYLGSFTQDQIHNLIMNLDELDSLADVIIIDTGAGISNSVLEFVMASEEVLLVVTPEPTSITDSYSLLKTLNRNPAFRKDQTLVKIIVNRVLTAQEGKEVFQKLNAVAVRFLNMDIQYLGAVPSDEKMLSSIMQQIPVTLRYPNSLSAKAYRKLTEELFLEEINREGIYNGLSELFSGLLKKRFKRGKL